VTHSSDASVSQTDPHLQDLLQMRLLDNVTSIKYLSENDSRIRNKGRTLRRKELVDCVRGLG
jgi:hypothetical protein